MTTSPLAVVLGLLGLAAALAAGVWYATLRRAPSQELHLPSVVGLGEPIAVHRLRRDGLRVLVREPRGLGAGGVVVRELPPAGTVVARGSTVTLRVARR